MKEIIICDACKGEGKIEKNELTNYHHRERDYWDELCGKCGGTGRMVVETKTRKLTKEEIELRSRH
jgi:DnaJ-class molecular chaperone